MGSSDNPWRRVLPCILVIAQSATLMVCLDCCSAANAESRRSLPKIRVDASGRAFETEDGRSFVPFGVNYYRPDTGWAPQIWKQFDAAATRRDFDIMKQMGARPKLDWHRCVTDFQTGRQFQLQYFEAFLRDRRREDSGNDEPKK